MPSPNLEKIYAPDCYYHIYNRGVDRQPIFKSPDDYAVFLNILKRYLDTEPIKDNKKREYEWLHEKVDLLAFCLISNHFHLFVYQHTPEAMTRLLRGVGTSYTGYFNKKYKRTGPLFQDRYKATMVDKDSYLMHISRYIHLNPSDYKNYEWSSYDYYVGKKNSGWVNPDKILRLFSSIKEYEEFTADYEDYKKSLELIKSDLADQ